MFCYCVCDAFGLRYFFSSSASSSLVFGIKNDLLSYLIISLVLFEMYELDVFFLQFPYPFEYICEHIIFWLFCACYRFWYVYSVCSSVTRANEKFVEHFERWNMRTQTICAVEIVIIKSCYFFFVFLFGWKWIWIHFENGSIRESGSERRRCHVA